MSRDATGSTILIDANLLVLLVVGSVGLDLIGKHKRTKGYGVADYRLLLELLGPEPSFFCCLTSSRKRRTSSPAIGSRIERS